MKTSTLDLISLSLIGICILSVVGLKIAGLEPPGILHETVVYLFATGSALSKSDKSDETLK